MYEIWEVLFLYLVYAGSIESRNCIDTWLQHWEIKSFKINDD